MFTALTILKCWTFYYTCLKVSQKQVFFNDQLLSKYLTKIREIKGGMRHKALSFTPEEVTLMKNQSNLFSRNFCEGKVFYNWPWVNPLTVSPS